MMYPPGDGDSPAPPMHTPIPRNVDKRIDRLAIELAECRKDLSTKERHMMARHIAYRVRTYPRPTK